MTGADLPKWLKICINNNWSQPDKIDQKVTPVGQKDFVDPQDPKTGAVAVATKIPKTKWQKMDSLPKKVLFFCAIPVSDCAP